MLVYGLTSGLQLAGITLFPIGTKETLLMICGYGVVAILALVAALSGLALVRQRRTMPGWAAGALLGIFVLVLSAGIGLAVNTALALRDRFSSIHHSRQVAVSSFTKLNVVGDNASYVIQPSGITRVDIDTLGTADTSTIAVSEQNGTLTVDTTKYHPHRTCGLICPYGVTNTKIVIRVPGEGMNIPVQSTPGSDVEMDGMPKPMPMPAPMMKP
jgi:hypothetical protein